MMDGDPLKTQRDVGSAVVTELPAAGFDNGEEIGRGGFGIVYRCTQVDLDRTAAVKVLTAELDENRERFLREQRAMGRLTGHPNIVSVLQVGETDSGYPYLVMQYHRQAAACRHVDSRRCGAGPLRRASTVVLPHLLVFHEECDSHAREALGDREFEAAHQEGSAMSFDEAVAYVGGDA